MTSIENITQETMNRIRVGDHSGAEHICREALASGLTHKNIFFGLAMSLEAQGRLQEAQAQLEQVLESEPQSPVALANLGSILIKRGNPAKGKTLLEKAVGLAPNLGSAYRSLAVAYMELADWPRTAATARIAQQANPQDPYLANLLGFALIQDQQYAAGLKAYDHFAGLTALNYKAPERDSNLIFETSYSRNAPSPRYFELGEQYTLMHEQESGDDIPTFAGVMTFLRIAPFIRDFFASKDLKTALDYGGGRGVQYGLTNLRDRNGADYASLPAFLGLESVSVYDAGRPDTAEALNMSYDAVICTDVLEHCDRQDLPWIVRELFAHAGKALFATIATYPALKHLPNGENAHCTLEPASWWCSLFRETAKDFPAVDYAFLIVGDRGLEHIDAFAGGPSSSS